MAQNVQIPIAFEFRPLRASWDAVAAKVTGWVRPKSASAKSYFLAKVTECGTPYLLEVPWWGLPQQALMLLRSDKSNELPDVRGYSTDLLVCSPFLGRTTKKPEADPWAMRKEFLRLKRNTKALLAFLKKWGGWGITPTTLAGYPERLHTPPNWRTPSGLSLPTLDPERMPNVFGRVLDGSAHTYILPSDIWEFQQRCRDALKNPAHEWLARAQKLFAVTPRPEYPHFLLLASNCQEAIRTTITIDLLKKVKFRICARPDCGSPFPIENRHRREYCCQYCAHVESVRRQRRTAKQEAMQLSKGVTHAKRQGAR